MTSVWEQTQEGRTERQPTPLRTLPKGGVRRVAAGDRLQGLHDGQSFYRWATASSDWFLLMEILPISETF